MRVCLDVTADSTDNRCHFLVKEVKSLSRVQLFVTPRTVACQGPLSMGFRRQEYRSGLPFPSPGDLPDLGIEPMSPQSAGRFFILWGFSGSSAHKESACKAGDPSLILGSGRTTKEGIGYSLQYSCAYLVAQLVKNLPVMQETWAPSLGREDPVEKGKATHSSILALWIPWTV